MRVGQKVSFIDLKDERHTGTIVDIVGTGASLFKKLNIQVGGQTVEDVPHENDAEVGDEFWLELGAKRKSVEKREEEGVLIAEPIVADNPVIVPPRARRNR